jgi:hypothetical protein
MFLELLVDSFILTGLYICLLLYLFRSKVRSYALFIFYFYSAREAFKFQ